MAFCSRPRGVARHPGARRRCWRQLRNCGIYGSVVVGQGTQIYAGTILRSAVQLGYTQAAIENAGYRWESNATKVKAAALEARIQTIESHIGALQPAVYVSRLHEVTITQKLLLLEPTKPSDLFYASSP